MHERQGPRPSSSSTGRRPIFPRLSHFVRENGGRKGGALGRLSDLATWRPARGSACPVCSRRFARDPPPVPSFPNEVHTVTLARGEGYGMRLALKLGQPGTSWSRGLVALATLAPFGRSSARPLVPFHQTHLRPQSWEARGGSDWRCPDILPAGTCRGRTRKPALQARQVPRPSGTARPGWLALRIQLSPSYSGEFMLPLHRRTGSYRWRPLAEKRNQRPVRFQQGWPPAQWSLHQQRQIPRYRFSS
jgi:hypothetical protein